MLYRRWMKRLIDFTVAVLLLIVLGPLLLLLWAVVRWKLGSPVFYRQERPGLGEQPFRIFKFRTMTQAHDADGQLLTDQERITPLGVFLRKTSLDELPELINVLGGEMSLVGPRPLLPRYLPYYTERERVRHTMRPGITGLAQVSGRNNLDWTERLARDVEYVERCSFALDCTILAKTVLHGIRGSDVVVVPNTSKEDLDVKRSKSRRGAR